MNTSAAPSNRLLTVLCFICVYGIWGSTYLAIKFAIAEIPPFTLAAGRFVLAGILLFLLAKLRKELPLTRSEKKWAAISGALLVFANSLVCLAETWISSGTAAILVGSMPIWVVLLNGVFFHEGKPTLRQITGIALSFIGVILLTRSQAAGETLTGSGIGIFAVVTSVILWSLGTLLQKKAGSPPNIFGFSAFQLLTGSFVPVVIAGVFESGLVGTAPSWTFSTLSLSSVLAFVYLVLFGSAIAFSAFLWLARNVEATKVSTYSVVNPVVAVWLGWLFLDEAVNPATVFFSLLILAGIYLVVFAKKKTSDVSRR